MEPTHLIPPRQIQSPQNRFPAIAALGVRAILDPITIMVGHNPPEPINPILTTEREVTK